MSRSMPLTREWAAYTWLKREVKTSWNPLQGSNSLFWLIMIGHEVAIAVWASRHNASPWYTGSKSVYVRWVVSLLPPTFAMASSVPRKREPRAIAFSSRGAEKCRNTNVERCSTGNIGMNLVKNIWRLLSRKRGVRSVSSLRLVTLWSCSWVYKVSLHIALNTYAHTQ